MSWPPARSHQTPLNRTGLSLIELMVVVAIVAIISGFLFVNAGRYSSYSRKKAAKVSLANLRDAILGSPEKPGFRSDLGHVPNNLNELFIQALQPNFNRDTGLGWRGPYMLNGSSISSTALYHSGFSGSAPFDFIAGGDQTLLDPWGNPFILERIEVTTTSVYLYDRGNTPQLLGPNSDGLPPGDYSRLVSAGPGGVLNTVVSNRASDILPNRPARGDDIVVFLTQSDPDPVPPTPGNADSDFDN